MILHTNHHLKIHINHFLISKNPSIHPHNNLHLITHKCLSHKFNCLKNDLSRYHHLIYYSDRFQKFILQAILLHIVLQTFYLYNPHHVVNHLSNDHSKHLLINSKKCQDQISNHSHNILHIFLS